MGTREVTPGGRKDNVTKPRGNDALSSRCGVRPRFFSAREACAPGCQAHLRPDQSAPGEALPAASARG
ncbi:hypothetical protein NDU88_010186 [Pleurodeles waltl]|uniref:Uncharacterized protein n=1 Tax=Pleurodeles waltl TaxID=8319 RepID=A0AAV7S1W5_PLEWA|nr:hypothetical protein NDU88_010186 [Pleurodeles waltl]